MYLHSRPLTGWIGSGALLACCACSKPESFSSAPSSHPSGDATSSTSTSTPPANDFCGSPRDVTAAESAFEPAWLPNVPLDNGARTLTVFASTLRQGMGGLELYVGICNHGPFPLCSAAMQVEFYDHAEQLIGTASTGVHTGRLYRLPDSETTIYCVPPGQMGFAAATTLPEGLVLDDLKSLGHRFPAFQIDGAVPLLSARVSEVDALDVTGGTVFRGIVTNDADEPVREPAVVVFAINEVGRPLAAATSTAMVEIPPGGVWSFETGIVAERGADQIAFATASFAASP